MPVDKGVTCCWLATRHEAAEGSYQTQEAGAGGRDPELLKLGNPATGACFALLHRS